MKLLISKILSQRLILGVNLKFTLNRDKLLRISKTYSQKFIGSNKQILACIKKYYLVSILDNCIMSRSVCEFITIYQKILCNNRHFQIQEKSILNCALIKSSFTTIANLLR